MASTREEFIYMARVCEQTERFEDMIENLKNVVNQGSELSNEERNLLSVAYKNSVGTRRTAWRVLSSIEQKEEQKGSRNIAHIKTYKKKIEAELNLYCNSILKLISEKLVPQSSSQESKVFFLKMKGDYHRYVSEYATGDQLSQTSKDALEAYKSATDIATAELKTTNPIRLGLALNFSVFHYEVMNDPSKACNLAKQAFDDAIADIEHIEEDQYKDATTIMQLIRDNLTLWTNDMQDDAEGGDGTNVENL